MRKLPLNVNAQSNISKTVKLPKRTNNKPIMIGALAVGALFLVA
jgi:hypothetical protein